MTSIASAGHRGIAQSGSCRAAELKQRGVVQSVPRDYERCGRRTGRCSARARRRRRRLSFSAGSTSVAGYLLLRKFDASSTNLRRCLLAGTEDQSSPCRRPAPIVLFYSLPRTSAADCGAGCKSFPPPPPPPPTHSQHQPSNVRLPPPYSLALSLLHFPSGAESHPPRTAAA